MSFVQGVVNEEKKEFTLLITAPNSGTASVTIGGDTSTVTPSSTSSSIQITHDAPTKNVYFDLTVNNLP